MPIATPKFSVGVESAGARLADEAYNTAGKWGAWNGKPTYVSSNSGKLNAEIPETLAGNESERAWVRSMLEAETDLTLIGKMKRGTQGAWLARTAEGEHQIFKFVSNNDARSQLQLSAESALRVNSGIARTPQFRQIGFTDGKGSWYTQEFLPGIPATQPTDRLISRMLILNDAAAGKALAAGKNWSDEVMGALYRDSKGWQQNIAKSGEEGKQFVDDIQKLVDRNRNLSATTGDIVHGDFQHYNALVDRRGKLSAYIDWEGAGRGDRGIDLSRLLYDAYVAEKEIGFRVPPETLKMLHNRIIGASGTGLRDNYMSYWALQVADYGTSRGPADASMFIGVGRRILSDLKGAT